MCYMKHEAAKTKVSQKLTAKELKKVSQSTKPNSAAKKLAGNTDSKIQKQPSAKKLDAVKKSSAANVLTQSAKKKAEKVVSKVSARIVKNPKIETIVSIKKANLAEKKAESKVSEHQTKQKSEKVAPSIQIEKSELKSKKPKVILQTVVTQQAPKKLKTIVSTKITKPTVAIKKTSVKNISSAVKIISDSKKTPPVSAAKLNLKTSVEIVQTRVPKVENAIPKNIKAIDAGINLIGSTVNKAPKRKKIKPISSAVFRGKKDRYSFEVFSISEEFEAVPAVFVISRRKTDRLKKAHHSLVCIGQTNSIFDELKKHRKGKCVKKHQANVVSILPETDERIRLRIENDLKAAHSVACSFE